MAKSIWPHHISCACQACELRRAVDMPEMDQKTWWEIVTRRAREMAA